MIREDKLRSLENIKGAADMLRSLKEPVVTTNGCFDILHYGHVQNLRLCRTYGPLIVGLNSDASVKRLKGEGRPINPLNARAYMLASLECVDYVVPFDEDTPVEFLRATRPDYHCKSRSGYKGVEEPILKEWGGKLVLVDDFEGYSSTRMIEKLVAAVNNRSPK